MIKFNEESEINDELPVYELFIDDNMIDGIDAMGFVDYPAIEQDLVYFSKGKVNYTFGKEDEKGVIVSPALIPDKKVYRYDPWTNEEYYVFFSKESVRKASEEFLISGKFKNTTEQHIHPVQGINLIHSWIVENQQDQLITKYNYKNIPDGTWGVSYKITNEDIKNKIKNGEIRGISIEAWLSEKLILRSEQMRKEKMKNDIKDILLKMDI